MPQLRKDPIIGRWVIIATERAKRPDDFGVMQDKELLKGKCPFCEGDEDQTPPEVYASRHQGTQPNSPGWDVRVVSSIAPLLKIEGELNRHGIGMYDAMSGIGAHEIIIETPRHISNICDLETDQVARVIDAYIARMKDLQNYKRFKYVLVFKNYGYAAGGSRINHSRSQLIATPINPKRVKEELVGSRRYFEYKERCIFCDIIKQELEEKTRIVAEIDGFIILSPFAARFPFELWILPKEHSCDFYKLPKDDVTKLAAALKTALGKISKALHNPPYNYVIHTAPFRNEAKEGYWKTIEKDYHWHIEIMPRLTQMAGFEWGTGFYINPTPPEDAAKFLRETDSKPQRKKSKK
jgi:UDPglucose--hexose-1-phosphate uridylyltransferase